jgi:mercuric ion transport protein
MTIKDDYRADAEDGSAVALMAAGILGALAASSCCLLPLLLVSLGISGAWIGNLTALAAYQPIIVLITLSALGCGFYLVYSHAPPACEGEACQRPLARPLLKAGLWLGTVLVLSALLFPHVAAMLGDI